MPIPPEREEEEPLSEAEAEEAFTRLQRVTVGAPPSAKSGARGATRGKAD
jgi:hypothetical protein